MPGKIQYILDGNRNKHFYQSMRLLNFICGDLHKKVVPVGPNFQTDIPSGLSQYADLIILSGWASGTGPLRPVQKPPEAQSVMISVEIHNPWVFMVFCTAFELLIMKKMDRIVFTQR